MLDRGRAARVATPILSGNRHPEHGGGHLFWLVLLRTRCEVAMKPLGYSVPFPG